MFIKINIPNIIIKKLYYLLFMSCNIFLLDTHIVTLFDASILA